MNPKPTRSDDDKQIELPVLEEVVDTDHERERLIAALDELARLVDRVPKPGTALSDDDLNALRDDLNRRLIEMVDDMAERMKHAIPTMVEQTLREHLKK